MEKNIIANWIYLLDQRANQAGVKVGIVYHDAKIIPEMPNSLKTLIISTATFR